jgi:hypothetical protein
MPALPFTHFTEAEGGLLLTLRNCPICEQLMRERQFPMGNNTPAKLERSGVKRLTLAPPRSRESEAHGTICETCAGIDPTSRATPAPKTIAERLDPGEPSVPEFVASEALGILEEVWEALRVNTPDLPAAVLVLASGTEDVTTPRFGHWAASRWRVDDIGTRRPEVLIAGEALDHGAEQVFATLLHEAAHGLAHARGIKDTSRQGRYHNLHFKLHAEELGLEVRKGGVHGFCHTLLSENTKQLWADQLEALDALCVRGARPAVARRRRAPSPPAGGERRSGVDARRTVTSEAEAPSEGASGPSEGSHELPELADGVRVTLVCACPQPRRIRVAPSVARMGAISCGLCGESFRYAPPRG